MDRFRTLYSESAVQKFILNTYVWMTLGLLLTAVTSILMITTGIYSQIILKAPYLILGLVIAELVLVFVFSLKVNTLSVGQMKAIFLLYAFSLGISLTPLAVVYDLATIGIAFLVSAVLFMSLVVIGMTTKRDLSKIGTICIAGLLALIVTQVILMLIGASINTLLISVLGLLIFTGLTAWDVQRVNQLLVMNDGSTLTQEKISIFMALRLYLDFINLFLYVLRLLGRQRN